MLNLSDHFFFDYLFWFWLNILILIEYFVFIDYFDFDYIKILNKIEYWLVLRREEQLAKWL